MAILYVYLDESGKKNDHPVVTFSGVCASVPRISRFNDAWNVLLRQYGLSSLHMAKASRLKEANGPKMPRHQSITDRIEALKPFADCINEHFEYGLTMAFDVSGFHSLRAAAAKGAGSPDDPNYLGFVRGLLAIIDYVHDDDKIALVCDYDLETAWGLYSHYVAVRKVHEEVREKTVSISFADDRYFPALQAADMTAFLSRLQAKRKFYDDYNMYSPLFVYLTDQRAIGHIQWEASFNNYAKLKETGEGLGKLSKPKKQK